MKKFFVAIFLIVMFFVPVISFAQTGTVGIPCDGPECDFTHFMQLVSNVLQFLLLLAIPVATIAFAYSGWIMITSGGSDGKKDQAKEIFRNVLVGFVFILAAWLIVNTIFTTLLDDDAYVNLLGGQTVTKLC